MNEAQQTQAQRLASSGIGAKEEQKWRQSFSQIPEVS
jgi:hypothetical protein